MEKIIAITNLTLDGVMQAPGHANEDPRDGFAHDGWSAPFATMQQTRSRRRFRQRLQIHPLVLGMGRRLFAEGGTPSNFKLRDAKATANGVVVATYLPTDT